MRSLGVDVGVGKGLDVVLLDERLVPLQVRSHVRVKDVAAHDRRPAPRRDRDRFTASLGRHRPIATDRAGTGGAEHPVVQHPQRRTRRRATGSSTGCRWGSTVFTRRRRQGSPPTAAGVRRARPSRSSRTPRAVVLAGALPPNGVRQACLARSRPAGPNGVRTDELSSQDRIDAALAALTGLLALDGKRFAPGDPSEGVIVVPSVSLPATPYKHAAAPPRDARAAVLLLRLR